ncbi:MAG: glycerol-3-phosphate 1-O-acyltransferase PlsY [Tissierellia bacterium]|nr:glycerol-3-phosphate 1-O-acyltransferase PlsY [Tissierellia bacterium]
MRLFLVPVLAYLIGSFSSAYVIGRAFRKIDIRKFGSGNPGTTNAMRVLGKKYGLLTFTLDFSKGIIASLVGLYLYGYYGGLLASLFVVIGHNWPIFFKLKGGKGIATTIAALAVLQFQLTLIAVLIGVAVAAISKYVSLGSLVFLAINFILSLSGIIKFDVYTQLTYFLLFLLGSYRHKTNIKRLISGTENKIGR